MLLKTDINRQASDICGQLGIAKLALDDDAS